MTVSDKLTVTAVGDICLGGLLPREFIDLPEKIIPQEIKGHLCADIVFGNLESPFSGTGKTTKFGFLWSSQSSARILKYAGFNIVNLANNHIADCGYEGMLDTIRVLDEYGIQHVGVGIDLDAARKPAIFDFPTKEISVAIHGYLETNFENQQAQQLMVASSGKPGAAPLNHGIVEEDIKNSSKAHDIIVVSIHWSEQFGKNIAPWRLKVCKEIAEMGADLILGHHPHVLQGYLRYKGKLILGSLGNFYFPPYRNPDFAGGDIHYWGDRERQSVIVKVTFERKNLSEVSFTPVVQDKDFPILKIPSKEEGSLIFAELERLKVQIQSPFYPIRYFINNHIFGKLRRLARNPSKILSGKKLFIRIKNEPRIWKR